MNTTAQIIFLIFALTSSIFASNSSKLKTPKFAQQLAHDIAKRYNDGYKKDYYAIVRFHDEKLTYISCNVTGKYHDYSTYLQATLKELKTFHKLFSNVEYDRETGSLVFEYFDILDFKDGKKTILNVGKVTAIPHGLSYGVVRIEEECPRNASHVGGYNYVE